MISNLDDIVSAPLVAVDVETTGLHWYRDDMFGIALAVHDGEKIHSTYWDIRDKPRVLEHLRGVLPRCKRVVNHNIKFDAHFLLEQDIMLPGDIDCTQVRAALINEHEPHFSLDALCKKYVNEQKVDIWPELARLFGGLPTRAVQIKNLHRAPVELAARYATMDPVLAIKLYMWQEKEIAKQELEQICALEKALLPVLVAIERQGVHVDPELAHRQIAQINKRIDQAQTTLNRVAGKKVNANSPVQMRELFGVKKVDVGDRKQWTSKAGVILETTDGGEASIDKLALRAMADRGDKGAEAVLMLRRMIKARSFCKDHILGHEVKGRVYPNYNQTKAESGLGTGTGRFSVDDPALQQIPMHDRDVAELVRPCFIPEKGHKWGCADWSQFEFRWFAHYVDDPAINKMYEDNPNADFHQTVADITGITRDRKFAGDTANAKQINLGLVFGMGEGEMAYNMGMEHEVIVDKSGKTWKRAGDKARDIFAKYHGAIPGVKALLNRASSIARSRGYVKTAMGRHIRFPGGKFVHKAGGLVFQGTSADCIKWKMVELWPVCKEKGWRMLLSVHDELDFSIPAAQATKQKGKTVDTLRAHLETFDGEKCPIKCRIPIRSDINFGNNWWEACK